MITKYYIFIMCVVTDVVDIIIDVSRKKGDTFLLIDCVYSFTDAGCRKFAIKRLLGTPAQLKHVATLFCEMYKHYFAMAAATQKYKDQRKKNIILNIKHETYTGKTRLTKLN